MAVNKVIKSDGTTLIDITGTTATASDVVTGKVFFGADGAQQTGTASNDFVIAIKLSTSSGNYEPYECTFETALAAYNAGKHIAFVLETTGDPVPCAGAYYPSYNAFGYGIRIGTSGSNWTGVGEEKYMWTSTGITRVATADYYSTSNATATPEDVANGKIFYNATGYQVGTAATGGGSAITVIDETDEHGGTIRTITAVDLSADTVTAATLLQGYTAHDRLGNAITGTASGGGSISLQTKTKTYTPTESQQTETVTADSGYNGLSQVSITVNAVSSTYVGTGVTRQAAKTVTPTKSSQTAVASGVYTTGAITVAAIPAQYITTTDATATAAQINSGATAYVNGVKVTGTQVIQHYYTGSSDPSASTGSDGDIYLKVVT